MSLITCPECGNKISDKAQSCPNCGHPIERNEHMCEQSSATTPVDGGAVLEATEPVSQREGHTDRKAACPPHFDTAEGEALTDSVEYGTVGNDSESKHGFASKRHRGERRKLRKGALALIAVGLFELVVGVLLVTNIICIHEWSGNNCEEANHCFKCGKVDPNGKIDPDAHMWNAADCVSPRTCARCGLTDGKKNPNKHALEDYEGGGKICWKCGKIFGSKDMQSKAAANSDSEPDGDSSESHSESSSRVSSSSVNRSSSSSNNDSSDDYDYYSDPETGMKGVIGDDGSGIVVGDDFAAHINEDGTSVATDGKGNWIADTDGDGVTDSISTDGGNTWSGK